MPRLPSNKIQEILVAHSKGVPKSTIAQTVEVDVSTVRATIVRFEKVYGSSSSVYALIRPVQRQCPHPSMKCLVCGQAQDAIHRHELETIERLSNELLDLKTRYNLIDDIDAVQLGNE